ncbi:MAG: hypothetical protein IK100_05620 [Muribaculaceae bacterium]|nr:hypothetical protein [Muribaculaceae bacterium]MBR5118108.1 hypothetical protein [Muribaculaceae bacterium]
MAKLTKNAGKGLLKKVNLKGCDAVFCYGLCLAGEKGAENTIFQCFPAFWHGFCS